MRISALARLSLAVSALASAAAIPGGVILQRAATVPVSPASFSSGSAAGDAAAFRGNPASLTASFTPGGLLARPQAETDDVRVNDFLGDHLTPCTTQNEAALVALDANRIAVGFNDSAEACISLDSFTGFAYSSDGGASFTDGGRMPPADGGRSAGDPSLVADRQGRIYFATLGNEAGFIAVPRVRLFTGRSALLVYRSDDGGQTWMAPVDGTAGLVANPHDKELLAVDNTGGPHDGNVYLTWVDFTAGTQRGVIQVSRSTDRGDTFSFPIKISKNDGDYDMGPYPAIGPNGELYVIWQTQLTPSPAIYFTSSLDGGQTFSLPRKIRTIKAPGHALNCGRQGMKGEIRMLAWPVIAVDHTPITDPENPPPHRGTIYVAYAAKNGTDEGDIFMIRSKDGGLTWNPPSPSLGVKVNDDAATRDQFNPAIANKADGEVALFWNDRRADPNNTMIEMYAARSMDGGATWGQNVKVSDVAFEGIGNTFQRDSSVVDCYMGDYNQMVPFKDGYAAVWGDNRDRYPANEAGARSDPNVYFDSFTL